MKPPIPRGTVILLPFPFADLSDTKIRPALVVSRSDRSDSDVIVAFIGTYRGQALADGDLLIGERDPNFRHTGFKVASVVRLGRLATLSVDDVIGKLGFLPSSLLAQADDKLRLALEL